MTPYLFFLFSPPSPSLFRRTEESCKVEGGEGKRKGPVAAAEGGRKGGARRKCCPAQGGRETGRTVASGGTAPSVPTPPPRPPCILKDTLKNGKSKSRGDDQVFRLQSFLFFSLIT